MAWQSIGFYVFNVVDCWNVWNLIIQSLLVMVVTLNIHLDLRKRASSLTKIVTIQYRFVWKYLDEIEYDTSWWNMTLTSDTFKPQDICVKLILPLNECEYYWIQVKLTLPLNECAYYWIQDICVKLILPLNEWMCILLNSSRK